MNHLSQTNFSKIYQQLNIAQKQAVDAIEGPVMVVAGPGTGKTQVLSARIANMLLKTDVQPHNILALTFTDSAAKNMQQRVVAMIGQPGYYVQIATFHAFCKAVIETHPESFPIDRDSQPLTDLEKFNLLQNIILELSLEALKPLNRPMFYIKEVMKALSDLKREGVDPSAFRKVIEKEFGHPPASKSKVEQMRFAKQKQKNEELLMIYQEYEERLRQTLRFDFDDMISLVVAAFSNDKLLLLEYQEQLQYILVDEYQDTNSAQNKVVNLLSSYWGEQANIFVVGDPHQSIYRFQGASLENVFSFVELYPQLTLVTLDKGYRCPQPIYDAAHQLISNNQQTDVLTNKIPTVAQVFHQKLDSHVKITTPPHVMIAPSQYLELIQVAEKIHSLLQAKIPPEEIAVLYRTNAEAATIQDIFESWGIPYEIDGGKDILKTELIRQILEFWEVIDAIKNGQPAFQLFEVLCYPWLELPTDVVYKLARIAGKNKIPLYQVIEKFDAIVKKDNEFNLTPLEIEPLLAFMKKLEAWSILDAQVPFPEWFETVLAESGILAWISQEPNQVELTLNINALHKEVTQLAHTDRRLKLANVIQILHVMIDHGLSIYPEDLNIDHGAVRISTVHKAKGREWQYVFLVHCLDGRWGNRKRQELLPLPQSLLQHASELKNEQNEDERRLFYVALTRAKKQVFCSYPKTIITNQRVQEVTKSMFLMEIEDYLQTEKSSNLALIEKQEEYLNKLLSPPSKSLFKNSERELFAQLVARYKLSVSGLNSYLKDPEQFVKDYLLNVPQPQPGYMAYGVAMHAALEKLFKRWMEQQKRMELSELVGYFETMLGKQLLSEDEYRRRLQKGQEALAAYYEHQFSPKNNQVLYIEKFFGSGSAKTWLDDVPLSGRIDRVDWIDRQSKTVRVIDYKTGKPKSINEIEGKTVSANLSDRELSLPKSIRGPYKRQLLFYKLLAELDKNFVPQVTEAIFDFVEPKDNGKFVQRKFTLLDEDVSLLKDLIREIMAEIRSLTFLK